MRFMIVRKADAASESGELPSEELLAAMGRYSEELSKAGVFRGGEGLRSSANGARVKFSAGKPTVMDGPFTEAKELVAGFSIFEVDTLDEAIEWVKRWPTIDADGEAEIEIRQIFEPEDFGPAFTEQLRAQEESVRARVADQG